MKFELGLLTALLLATPAALAADAPNWLVAEAQEGGQRVILKFLGEMPSDTVRAGLSVLTVVSWKYDGASNEGLPSAAERERMNALEDALDLIEAGTLQPAFSRTGNNLKELAYYIGDRKQFLASLNQVLRSHPRYPIEIAFYEDPHWRELKQFIDGVPSDNEG